MFERDVEIVVLQDGVGFLLQLNDRVVGRVTAGVPVRVQKDEFTLVRRLKMRAVDEHDEEDKRQQWTEPRWSSYDHLTLDSLVLTYR